MPNFSMLYLFADLFFIVFIFVFATWQHKYFSKRYIQYLKENISVYAFRVNDFEKPQIATDVSFLYIL